LQSEYALSVVLDYFTEVAEQLLPAHEPNEKFFRLMVAMLAHLRSGGDTWMAVTYFTVWTVRLLGLWPEAQVSGETVEIVHEMFEQPITALAPRPWSKSTASDLRRVLIRTMELHAERRFLTVPLLEAL